MTELTVEKRPVQGEAVGAEHTKRPFRKFSAKAAGRVAILGSRIEGYDPATPEAEHLRGHQVEAVQKFREVSGVILSGDISNEGMAILHPTGSGKTVTSAELMRIVCGEIDDIPSLRALMLVPGHKILRQTTGDDDELGAIRTFTTSVTVAEYSGRKKQVDAHVTVMTYQALPWAIERGDIDLIDPSMIVCDEAHHIIDGAWAQAVESISKDRLLVGLTATPAYSAERDVGRLFPNVLVRKSMREGINGGMLSDLQGFTYRGSSRVQITRPRGVDFAEEDLFNAIANSKDNYLAAKLCAREIEMGRRGVISCVPGFDRAHAKIVAEILSKTKVQAPEGERYIRAAFVGGEVHDKELDRIFAEYREGRIDVITYVNLLLEGWDSPESDFTVLLRPTLSRVLAEQRLGRILRRRPGKVATVHEILYEMSGPALQQVTYQDVLDEEQIIQANHFGWHATDEEPKEKRERPQAPVHIFSVADFTVDLDLEKKLAELDDTPMEEARVLCGQDAIPFEWPTAHILSRLFDVQRETVEQVLTEAALPSRSEDTEGVTRVYYPPRASQVMAKHLGLKQLPAEAVTMPQLMRYHRAYWQYRRVTRRAVEAALEEEGIRSELYITEEGSVIRAYPALSKEVAPMSISEIAAKSAKDQEENEESSDVLGDTVKWLKEILINPNDAPTAWQKRQVQTAQSALLAAIQKLEAIDPVLYRGLKSDLNTAEITPSTQMHNVMKARELDFIELVVAASRARETIKKMEAKKWRGKKNS